MKNTMNITTQQILTEIIALAMLEGKFPGLTTDQREAMVSSLCMHMFSEYGGESPVDIHRNRNFLVGYVHRFAESWVQARVEQEVKRKVEVNARRVVGSVSHVGGVVAGLVTLTGKSIAKGVKSYKIQSPIARKS